MKENTWKKGKGRRSSQVKVVKAAFRRLFVYARDEQGKVGSFSSSFSSQSLGK